MNSQISDFFDRLKDKKIAIIGIGVSHTDLIELWAKKGLDVTACDRRTEEQLGEVCQRLKNAGAKLRLGADSLEHLQADIILRTPGMSFHSPELLAFRRQGVVVTSELELFFDLCPCKIIGVTGSDGKTTTTSLIAAMLRREGHTVHLGGNIGAPLLTLLERIRPEDYAAVELSSFQLLSMRQSPDIALITNISPNHLDVHASMEEYIGAKLHILFHQNAFSRTVLNADNEITAGFTDLVRGECLLFSRKQAPPKGMYLDPRGIICFTDGLGTVQVMDSRDLRLPGVHNIENVMAAMAAVQGIVSFENMAQAAREFTGVEHRMEFVRELEGVRYYNDTIASSPTRTIAGLQAYDRKCILIAGGYDKNIPYAPLAPVILEHVKALILTGATADKIEQAVTQCDGYPDSGLQLIRASGMAQAVSAARALAVPGDIVTLSPASASFDAYPNFEARGLHFKQLVNAL